MNDDLRLKKEKLNKQIAFVILVACCAICTILSITGGIYKFILFVEGMNPQDSIEETVAKDDFLVDGELHFKNGVTELGRYKCNASSCGWAPGSKDDLIYEIKSPFTDNNQSYKISGTINSKYAFIYDDENASEPSNIFLYDITNGSTVEELSAVKNYNMDTGKMYFVKNRQGKWGVISLAEAEMKQIIDYQFDFIGVVLSEGESITTQKLLAVRNGEKWAVTSTNLKTGIISIEFDEHIIYYSHKLVVTRDKSVDNVALFNVYALNGNQLEKSATSVELLPNNMLLVTTDKTISLYDTGNAKELFKKEYNTVSDVTHEVKEDKLLIKMGTNVEFETPNKALGIAIEDEKYIQEVPASNGGETNQNPA